jgi:[ribosomal protein S5]-alanine N-acetyltransferase
MEITLTRCTIREWRVGDEDSLVRHANNPKIWRNVRDAFPHPYTRRDAEQWIALSISQSPAVSFAIEIDGEAVGGIGLVPREDVYRRSIEIGYWLGEAYWGRGVMTEAVRAITDYAFSNFDVCRVFAGVFEWNRGSARVLEKAGFEFETRLKNSITKQGQSIDELLYAMVRFP